MSERKESINSRKINLQEEDEKENVNELNTSSEKHNKTVKCEYSNSMSFQDCINLYEEYNDMLATLRNLFAKIYNVYMDIIHSEESILIECCTTNDILCGAKKCRKYIRQLIKLQSYEKDEEESNIRILMIEELLELYYISLLKCDFLLCRIHGIVLCSNSLRFVYKKNTKPIEPQKGLFDYISSLKDFAVEFFQKKNPKIGFLKILGNQKKQNVADKAEKIDLIKFKTIKNLNNENTEAIELSKLNKQNEEICLKTSIKSLLKEYLNNIQKSEFILILLYDLIRFLIKLLNICTSDERFKKIIKYVEKKRLQLLNLIPAFTEEILECAQGIKSSNCLFSFKQIIYLTLKYLNGEIITLIYEIIMIRQFLELALVKETVLLNKKGMKLSFANIACEINRHNVSYFDETIGLITKKPDNFYFELPYFFSEELITINLTLIHIDDLHQILSQHLLNNITFILLEFSDDLEFVQKLKEKKKNEKKKRKKHACEDSACEDSEYEENKCEEDKCEEEKCEEEKCEEDKCEEDKCEENKCEENKYEENKYEENKCEENVREQKKRNFRNLLEIVSVNNELMEKNKIPLKDKKYIKIQDFFYKKKINVLKSHNKVLLNKSYINENSIKYKIIIKQNEFHKLNNDFVYYDLLIIFVELIIGILLTLFIISNTNKHIKKKKKYINLVF